MNLTEEARAQAFYQQKHQDRYRFAHCFKRHVLSQNVPMVAPQAWRFLTTQYGKPYVDQRADKRVDKKADKTIEQSISFNLSHSDDAVVMAVLLDNAQINNAQINNAQFDIGVDVEYYRELPNMVAMLDMVCHPDEKKAWHVATDKVKTFYRLWTAKEALLKACGSGLIDALSDINCVQCLNETRCKIHWQQASYWVECKGWEWGVCSVSWRDELIVDRVCFIDQKDQSANL